MNHAHRPPNSRWASSPFAHQRVAYQSLFGWLAYRGVQPLENRRLNLSYQLFASIITKYSTTDC